MSLTIRSLSSAKRAARPGALVFGVFVLLFGQSVAGAEEQPTYEGLRTLAEQDPSCIPNDHLDFVLVDCIKSQFTLWYFTKPNHPAHPGVIKRQAVQSDDGGWTMKLDGFSFASDSGQPAFKEWLEQIAALDRQMREDMAKKPMVK